MLIHGLLYNTARYVALRGKNQEAYVKKKNICIFKKDFSLDRDKHRYISEK